MADMIRKAIAAPAGDDPLTYVMSDETVDRMGDVIEADGWKLTNFLKNPIALFNHDYKFVIGHWTDVKVQGAKLIGKLNLLPQGISDRLDEIRAAVEAGVLRAVSVGFTADPDAVEPMKTGGYRFGSTELMECSLVSVPANPNALQIAKSLHLSDEVQAMIFGEPEAPADPEIPAPRKVDAAPGKKTVVVKLDAPARDRAPFVIKKIHPERKRA
jgi:HK97 family phage prohead protease